MGSARENTGHIQIWKMRSDGYIYVPVELEAAQAYTLKSSDQPEASGYKKEISYV